MIKGKTVLGLIPARGGSKRIPFKNLQKLGDSTLLEIAISQARDSHTIDEIVVSSDNNNILTVAKGAGVSVLRRPDSLALDVTPGIAPVLHALAVYSGYDYIVLLQVTSPFRSAEDIDSSIELCVKCQAPACVSVCHPQHHPSWMYKVDTDRELKQLLSEVDVPSRSQDLSPCYVLNGAVYVAECESLAVNKSFLTERTVAYDMPSDRSLDIDTEYDLQLARAIWMLMNK